MHKGHAEKNKSTQQTTYIQYVDTAVCWGMCQLCRAGVANSWEETKLHTTRPKMLKLSLPNRWDSVLMRSELIQIRSLYLWCCLFGIPQFALCYTDGGQQKESQQNIHASYKIGNYLVLSLAAKVQWCWGVMCESSEVSPTPLNLVFLQINVFQPILPNHLKPVSMAL